MKKNEKEAQIKLLLESRRKTLKRLEKIKAIFKEEKENEDAWPGHAGTRFQIADSDQQVLLQQLEEIEVVLKKLGYKK